MMEATIRGTTVNDDAAAALRRGVGFAALFGLAGVAAIACTARGAAPVPGPATDRLLAQEALWTAELTGASTLAFAPGLVARRNDPVAIAAMADARRRLMADAAAAEARRGVVLRRIDDARAERDLNESRNTVVMLKLDSALEKRSIAQQRGDRVEYAAQDQAIRTLRIVSAKAINDAAAASRTINALGEQMAVLAARDRDHAQRRLDDVRAKLRGA
ncbi:hypothetical protein ASE95_12090 [Sphingomonas sp. Leaf231]|uniref:hypothetical protein n=1 Tax=Sphingomonas sp. Leaf231 TaxID=1736301 RepID=UPI0007001659|nr:hypothetical protein [Sphingomonas sp. Leaf231]KQN91001.1 hypothetical protein ASE95_12090 [Sphingomonas sp. Leaf231]